MVAPRSRARAACALRISSPRAAAHSGQVKTPRSWSASAMAKACASHGSRNKGSPQSSGMPGRLAADAASGRLEIGFPGIDQDLQLRVALGAPQFAALELHGVEPLRLLAGTRRIAVGKDVAAVHALDRAEMAANVARQARMPTRVHGPGAHPVAWLEARRRIGLPPAHGSPPEHPAP